MPELATEGVPLRVARRQAAGQPRPQPIRDAILRFLTEPRSAGEIAEHIARPVPTATGHLGAMIRLGLVQRLGFGTYAAAPYCGPKVRLPSRHSLSSRDLRSRLRTLLRDRCSVQGLRLTTGATERAIRHALKDLWLSGLIEGDDQAGYGLVRWLNEKQYVEGASTNTPFAN